MRGLVLGVLMFLMAACAPQPADSTCPPPDQVRQMLETAGEMAGQAIPLKPITAIEFSGAMKLCRSDPTAVLCKGAPGRMPVLADVVAADAKVRADFEYRSDFLQYGEDDVWVKKTSCGDCEDYAMTVAETLAEAGIGGQYMALILWLPTPYIAHATLVVLTDNGPFEVGVGPTETPHPFDVKEGQRMALLPFDGSGHAYAINGGSAVVFAIDDKDGLYVVLTPVDNN